MSSILHTKLNTVISTLQIRRRILNEWLLQVTLPDVARKYLPLKAYWLLVGVSAPRVSRCMRAKLFQSCPTLWDAMDCSPPGSLSVGFSRQEGWSGLPCPPSGDPPDPGIEPISLMSPAWGSRFFTTSTTWEATSVKVWTMKYEQLDEHHLEDWNAKLPGHRPPFHWFDIFLDPWQWRGSGDAKIFHFGRFIIVLFIILN